MLFLSCALSDQQIPGQNFSIKFLHQAWTATERERDREKGGLGKAEVKNTDSGIFRISLTIYPADTMLLLSFSNQECVHYFPKERYSQCHIRVTVLEMGKSKSTLKVHQKSRVFEMLIWLHPSLSESWVKCRLEGGVVR